PPKTFYPSWSSNFGDEATPNGDLNSILETTGDSPYSWSMNKFTMAARPMPEALKKTALSPTPTAYISGGLTSFPYGQTYGVFEIVAKVPKGKGLWPAFWLIPVDKSWPPEIDVFEVLGSNPKTVYTTVHYKEGGIHKSMSKAHNLGVDLSADYHSYAVDWGPKQIKWYLDRKLVFTAPTPAQLVNKPCYLIANVAVGKRTSWGGPPDATTKFPAAMDIKTIRVWKKATY
ncbi:MAG: glycoside hydrolase family 16 protein, partial [Rickettsiales bacterium]|nr:glycoside hydrolase family 16 protein [Rickettsiales bacterium]